MNQAAERSGFAKTFHNSIFPLFLILVCPPTAMLMWYINVDMQGSVLEFWNNIASQGFMTVIFQMWGSIFFGTAIAWKIIFIFMASQLILMRVVPGGRFEGPITPQGNIPVYKNNGFACFVMTIFLFCFCSYRLHWFSATVIYDNFGAIIAALNVFSLVFCLFIYCKGKYAPSSSDSGASGNFIFDYYWGTELYPRIFGWDIKVFTNCRFGMMGWPIIILSFAAKQAQLYGLSNSMVVAVLIQMLYISKFFWWEGGYLRSIDIMHDRAGFYLCWGCLVWVPAIYTSPILYLVNHPVDLNLSVAVLIALMGITSVFINFFADRQRQRVRASNGRCKVWGKSPGLIQTTYTTEQGEAKSGILLTTGWWGLARHFHYLPEILAAFFWTVPALFFNALPYFYVVYLTILLVHRSYRDDERCSAKYGKYWKEYCEKVPYRILPGFKSRGYHSD